MFQMFQQLNPHKSRVPHLFRPCSTPTALEQEQTRNARWNTGNTLMTSRNTGNMFLTTYLSPEITKGVSMTADLPPRIHVDGLDHKPVFSMIIRKDLRTPGRIYFEGPKYASLTPEQAMAVANRIADTLDGFN